MRAPTSALAVDARRRSAARNVGLSLAGLIGLALGMVLWGPPDWLIDRVAALRPGCLYRATPHAPLIALTIDDGPDSVTTPLILAELRRYGARATFVLQTVAIRR